MRSDVGPPRRSVRESSRGGTLKKKVLAGVPIVVVTGQGDDTTASQFLRGGGDGLVRKMDGKDVILGALRTVMALVVA